MMKVKICGITNLKDAVNAEKCGADIIGFIFARSPRRIRPWQAKRIIRGLKLSTMKAGVFVDEDADTVNGMIRDLKLNIVQLSGSESPAYIKKIKGSKVIKTIKVRDKKSALREARKYGGNIYALLFDTYNGGLHGGTGRIFDWRAVKYAKTPFFVAGGLNPDNIREAIKQSKPFGVDVNSGVESRPGKKDIKKIKALFKAIS
jgi:phosphoribosylanthranilate isomerase